MLKNQILALITSRLNCYISLQSDCFESSLKNLQLIRILTGTRKRDHISPILVSLRLLQVKLRIEVKTHLLTNKAFKNQASSYVEDLMIPFYPNRAVHSQREGLFMVPRASKSRIRGSIFSYQAPVLWYQLLIWTQATGTLFSFKIRLKAFIYNKALSLGWIRWLWIIP